jgi:hypothetical protein
MHEYILITARVYSNSTLIQPNVVCMVCRFVGTGSNMTELTIDVKLLDLNKVKIKD